MRQARLAIAAAAAILAGLVIFSILYFSPALRMVDGITTSGSTISPAIAGAGLPGYNHTIISISGVKVLADIADSQDKKEKGLGVRENMTEGEGMLFLFDKDYPYPFWMIGMKFPIDIIWLDNNKTVVHIEHSLPPCPNQLDCPNHQPDHNARYVLETTAGFSDRHGVKTGTQVEFSLN